MKDSASLKGEPAATVVKRGVTVRIYGPLTDRKREVYLLAYYAGSRRERKTVKGDLEAAKREAAEICKGVSGGDIVDALHLSALDRRIYVTAKETVAPSGRNVDAICREAMEAIRLIGAGVTLRDAAVFWQKHHAGGMKEETVANVVKEYLDLLESKRRFEVTVRVNRVLLDRFAEAFKCPISYITTEDMEKWLNKLPRKDNPKVLLSPRSVNNYIAAIVGLFNYAKGKYIPDDRTSAAERLVRVSDEGDEPVEIWQPWEFELILAYAPEKIIPCLVLAAFAGIRTVELIRLEWSAIHLEPLLPKYPHGFIEISGKVAKQHRTARARNIPIQPNLVTFLSEYSRKQGRIFPYVSESSVARAVSDTVVKINRLEADRRKKDPSRPIIELTTRDNGCRHSFGTYRLPVLESASALANEMGNSEKEIYASYRKLVHPSDVEAWWKISRKRPAEVIQMVG